MRSLETPFPNGLRLGFTDRPSRSGHIYDSDARRDSVGQFLLIFIAGAVHLGVHQVGFLDLSQHLLGFLKVPFRMHAGIQHLAGKRILALSQRFVSGLKASRLQCPFPSCCGRR